jgi:hypothetical protein
MEVLKMKKVIYNLPAQVGAIIVYDDNNNYVCDASMYYEADACEYAEQNGYKVAYREEVMGL